MTISDRYTRLPASAASLATPWTNPPTAAAQHHPVPSTTIHSQQVLRLTGFARS